MKIILVLLAFVSLSIEVAADEKPPLVFLSELVDLSSGTNQVARVNDVQSLIQTQLARLGFTTSYEENTAGKKTGRMLIGTLAGRDRHFVTFVTHADTVFEPDSGFKELTVHDGIAKGPGVIDDKGGIIVALSGIRTYLTKHNTPPLSFRFVVSPNEEAGSAGFHDKFKQYAADSKLVLGFEPSSDAGSIIESRKGTSPFAVGKETRKYLQTYIKAVFEIEKIKITPSTSTESADTNEFARAGLVILDGLGATGGGMHTKDEHLKISSLKTRADILARFLELAL